MRACVGDATDDDHQLHRTDAIGMHHRIIMVDIKFMIDIVHGVVANDCALDGNNNRIVCVALPLLVATRTQSQACISS